MPPVGMHKNGIKYILTGIYRCLALDDQLKSCENFKQSRNKRLVNAFYNKSASEMHIAR